ncbi:hypothetical protein [Streptomyces sp. NPDC051554]|uniref:hypothetical protein n=1 Tax=Streptomyces sp. NPDC051554 TaxID=3365656 RepID=UPI003796B29C
MTPAARAARAKGAQAVNSPDGLITRIERAKANLTPAHIERLRALLAPSAAKVEGS